MAKNLISLKVNCPHCKKSLMDHTLFLNSKPSIKLRIELEGQQGTINMCSTYGCYDRQSSIPLKDGEIANLTCPHCKKDLHSTHLCETCNAPVVDFALDKGGKVHVCSRMGCEKHFVSFEDIYDTLTKFYHDYDYGAREGDF